MDEESPRIAPLTHEELLAYLDDSSEPPPRSSKPPPQSAEQQPATPPPKQQASGNARATRAHSPMPRILYTIARHPTLLRPMLGFSNALAMQGRLPRRDSEILALRTAWNCRSDFEWGHHVEYATGAGLSELEIERIAWAPRSEAWSPVDLALLAAADELHAKQRISDPTWEVLVERYDDAQRVEIPFVVGQYTMLSMVASSTGVTLEPGYAGLPDAPRC